MRNESSRVHGRGLVGNAVLRDPIETEDGMNRSFVHEILDKLEGCEGRFSELLVDSVTDESEANSPIKPAYQEKSDEVMYLSRTRKRTMRSKMVIERINDRKMKLSSNVTRR